MNNKLFYIALALAIGGLLVGVIVTGGDDKISTERIGEFYEQVGAEHVQPGQQSTPYSSVPATSGDHSAQVFAYGDYDRELTDYEVLHGLEHGGIAFWYNPATITDEELSQVRETFEGFAFNKKYLSARSDLDENVKLAMTAWTYLLNQEEIDVQEMTDFFNGHINKGPELAP